LAVTKALVYCATKLLTVIKSFITQALQVNTLKAFLLALNLNKLQCLSVV
jgi:hypothetical protein